MGRLRRPMASESPLAAMPPMISLAPDHDVPLRSSGLNLGTTCRRFNPMDVELRLDFMYVFIYLALRQKVCNPRVIVIGTKRCVKDAAVKFTYPFLLVSGTTLAA